MWRPAHGATSRPGPCRPASGYGCALGRPGPRADDPRREPLPAPDAAVFDAAVFHALLEGDGLLEVDVEVPAPVTP